MSPESQPPSHCFVCEAELPEPPRMPSDSLVWQVACPHCGGYALPLTDAIKLDLSPEERASLAGFLRHRAVAGQPRVALTSAMSANGRSEVVTISDALAARPRTVGAIQDAVLMALATMLKSPGDTLELSSGDRALAYSLETRDFDWHLDQLKHRGLVEHWNSRAIANLTHRGWERVDDLQRGPTQAADQAFVAMWFDDAMEEAYAHAIRPAVETAGFRPYRIKDVEHNNKICDEILAEIRRSRFLVAEFTGNRGGVYFEAGFAMGLGMPVVWVVKEADLAQVHFDTNHFNHVTWTEIDDLRLKLQRRIEATVPRPDVSNTTGGGR